MKIDISTFEREIAQEYLRLFENEMRIGDFETARQVMNIASTTAAIAAKLIFERLSKESGAIGEE